MLPAVAQGAIGLEILADDTDTARLIAPLNDAATALCVAAERMFLATLDGSCRTPIGGLAEISGGKIRMQGEILSPDGNRRYFAERNAAANEALRLGENCARELIGAAGSDFFRSFA
jgi:hydroxymethylbilane synthase